MSPFRFGLLGTGSTAGPGGWTAFARRVEDLGFAVLQVPQHFSVPSVPPLPALALAAAATSRLVVGTLVLDNETTHPAVVARDAAWLTTETGRRFELGIGAGWLAADHSMLGRPFRPAGERVDRLAEALLLIRAVWSGQQSFTGTHYTLDGLPEGAATPVAPPLLVGGGGPRVLDLAARLADIVGIAPDMRTGRIGRAAARTTGRAPVAAKAARIREVAADRGATVTLHMSITGLYDRTDTARIGRLADSFGVAAEQVPCLPGVLIGEPAEMADELRRRRAETGVSYLTVNESQLERMAPVVAELAGT
ncbi:TIGR03621 family F420-dependent LLM class oxidoreductase [Pseudonocardia nematodicida]|uniref:TIGR03621 family F420-dependent LLM class oxidoreductase n=1 Tax=Pseudonocardia nematodicida TaxID=1206997 RepID=A0ABV1K951_9PSEU